MTISAFAGSEAARRGNNPLRQAKTSAPTTATAAMIPTLRGLIGLFIVCNVDEFTLPPAAGKPGREPCLPPAALLILTSPG